MKYLAAIDRMAPHNRPTAGRKAKYLKRTSRSLPAHKKSFHQERARTLLSRRTGGPNARRGPRPASKQQLSPPEAGPSPSPDSDGTAELMDMLNSPTEVWLHGVTLVADLPPSTAACAFCGADPDTELLSCRGCGSQYHLYCVEERHMPCSEEAQLDWRCRLCLSASVSSAPTNHSPAEPTEVQDWPEIATSPVPLAALEPVKAVFSAPSSPAVLASLRPLLESWSCNTSDNSHPSSSFSPEAPQASTGITTRPGDKPPLAASLTTALSFTMEELVTGCAGSAARTVQDRLDGLQAVDQIRTFEEETSYVLPSPSSPLLEEKEGFRGFAKEEVHQSIPVEDICSRNGHSGFGGSKHLKRRGRPRKNRTIKLSASYNLRQPDERKSYRQTRLYRKMKEKPSEVKKKEQAASATGPGSVLWTLADDTGARPAVYTVPLQLQLLDAAAALALLQGPPPPSPDTTEAAQLGYRTGVTRQRPSRDLLTRLRRTVQKELDLLGYPAAAPPTRRRSVPPLRAMPDCMLEEEWQAWRRIMPPRRGRPRKFPRSDDLSWIRQMKQARGAPDRPEAPLQGRWCPWQACGVHDRPVVSMAGLWPVVPLTGPRCPCEAGGAPGRPLVPLAGLWCPWQASGAPGRSVVPLAGLC
ncbi:hypothetical protein FJT64_005161 [Amphibalanus amphitrite]|uniref:PHD-type domain-containing protein n=1 Tax=Amphibalanus amphitrite TaxID=1232801 RepID=A0A6A4W650_AMPAM|nr:hypothetical protein FJT64_005161 [Amphibalanus amphitrite]